MILIWGYPDFNFIDVETEVSEEVLNDFFKNLQPVNMTTKTYSKILSQMVFDTDSWNLKCKQESLNISV